MLHWSATTIILEILGCYTCWWFSQTTLRHQISWLCSGRHCFICANMFAFFWCLSMFGASSGLFFFCFLGACQCCCICPLKIMIKKKKHAFYWGFRPSKCIKHWYLQCFVTLLSFLMKSHSPQGAALKKNVYYSDWCSTRHAYSHVTSGLEPCPVGRAVAPRCSFPAAPAVPRRPAARCRAPPAGPGCAEAPGHGPGKT